MRTRRSARIGMPAAAASAVAAGLWLGGALCLGGAAAAAVRPAVGGPGSQLWVSNYNGPNHGFDAGIAAVASPDGSAVFVTGSSAGTNNTDDYATVAYDSATGAQMWASRYDGPGGQTDIPYAIGISPNGGAVYVTGASVGAGGDFDYATIAYNATTGAQVWVRRFDGPGSAHGAARSLAVSPDGRTVYITGYNGTRGRYDYVTIAYNTATGAQRWLSRYNGPAGGNDQARAVAVSPDGRTVYVTGRSRGATSGYDIATVAYNAATGARRWASRYNGPANLNDFGTAVAAGPGGRTVYVTGGTRAPGNRLNFVTIAYKSSTGKALWASRTRDGWFVFNGVGSSVGVTPDGRTVVVANYTAGTTTPTAYATTAYNASTGAARWSRRYAGPPGGNDNVPSALGISPDGNTVYVTGTSGDPTSGSAYATVAYQIATGNQVWVTRFTGVGDSSDQANALAINPEGNALYVIGSVEVSLTSGNFVTVAYQAR